MTKEKVDQETEQNDVAQEEAVDTEALIREQFDESISALDMDEDAVKMSMIQAGATFKNVTRLYNQFMIDAGLAISKADRNQIIEDTLEGREFEDEADFDSAVNDVLEAVTGATDRSAAALVRSYCKKADVVCYAKPKGTGATRSGFKTKYYDFLIGDPGCSVEDATAFIQGDGENEDTSDNIKKHLSHYLAIHAMANAIAAK